MRTILLALLLALSATVAAAKSDTDDESCDLDARYPLVFDMHEGRPYSAWAAEPLSKNLVNLMRRPAKNAFEVDALVRELTREDSRYPIRVHLMLRVANEAQGTQALAASPGVFRIVARSPSLTFRSIRTHSQCPGGLLNKMGILIVEAIPWDIRGRMLLEALNDHLMEELEPEDQVLARKMLTIAAVRLDRLLSDSAAQREALRRNRAWRAAKTDAWVTTEFESSDPH